VTTILANAKKIDHAIIPDKEGEGDGDEEGDFQAVVVVLVAPGEVRVSTTVVINACGMCNRGSSSSSGVMDEIECACCCSC
jgi:hypothetical protein